MHPNVNKYSKFLKYVFNFNAECKIVEEEIKNFTDKVEDFQKYLDAWINSNMKILKEMTVPETTHASMLVEIMEKGTDLAGDMTTLYNKESAYNICVTDFNKNLLAMSKNKNAEQLIRGLPKAKKFCEENFSEIRNKIAELKTEKKKVENCFNELKLLYAKALN